MIDNDFVYTRIGMALVSAQRVEFVTAQLVEHLAEFSKTYPITTTDFLDQYRKSKKVIKTLGNIFRLLKLNPSLVVEIELDNYLKNRNLFVHKFWSTYLQNKSQDQVQKSLKFCNDFGISSNRIESYFKGFIYFLALRHVKDRDDLDSETKKWDDDFKFFISVVSDKPVNHGQ
jgi:hypothetical protein